jgi:hypothetical protein
MPASIACEPGADAPIQERTSFTRLRYANCWEDAAVLVRGLAPIAGARCLSIASGGDNTFSLLARGATRVLAVDLSPAQIALCRPEGGRLRGPTDSSSRSSRWRGPGSTRGLRVPPIRPRRGVTYVLGR